MLIDTLPHPEVNAHSAETPFVAGLRKHSLLVFLALVLFGSLRIVATYTVFSHTWDEPNHIAAGTEWLTEGSMKLDFSHPPLARVAVALGPYLAHGASGTLPNPGNAAPGRLWDRASLTGLAILNQDGKYGRNLALARLGILPFFWIAALTVYLWARRYLGEPATAFAVFFFTFLPAILAHAGLATTDMAVTALVGATLLMAFIWTENPSPPRSLLLGAITGLAVLSKFSALPFIPVALAAAFVWRIVAERPPLRDIVPHRKHFAALGVAGLTCLLVIWGGYRFSFGMMAGGSGFTFPVPAPELFEGIRDLFGYNDTGHVSFLLGNHSKTGWWYFFPLVLAVKTPLPFLALLLFGAVAAIRMKGAGLALACSLGILLFSLTIHINLGVRHILVVYLGFSIVAGAGAARLLALSARAKWTGWVLAALIVWMAATSVLSHPDYLSYFNALAGNKPENVLVDSDLDWGQDLKRLAARLKEVGAPSVAFTSYLPVDLNALGFPPVTPENPAAPTPGWNAVSLTRLKLSEGDDGSQSAKPWQERLAPREKIGKGMWLWYFPPAATTGK